MNTETILEILRLAIDDVRDSRKYSQEIEDDFLNEKLEEVELNLWILHTKNQKIRRMLTDALKGLKESQETDGYDTKNEQYDIKTALDLIK